MTYALSVKSFSCWSCDHFRPISPTESVQGYCRKMAPCALDLYGAVSGSILTTKGDLLTRDIMQLQRQPIGVNNSFLVADSDLANGMEWKNLLTTEGDLMTINEDLELTRLPNTWVDEQVLTVDTAVSGAMNWKNPPMFFAFQAGLWDVTGLGGTVELGRLNLVTSTPKDTNLAISDDNLARYYNVMTEFPFLVPPNGYVVAMTIMVTAAAVHTAAVGPNPFMRFEFCINDGATEISRFNVHVPVPAAKVAISDNVAVDNCIQVHFELPSPEIVIAPAFGWRLVLGDGSNQNQIYAARNVLTQVYYKAVSPSLPLAKKALKSVTIEGDDTDLKGDDTDLEGDDTDLEGDDTDIENGEVESPFLGNMNPNLVSTHDSLNKWCPILVAPNEWCGDYKPASHAVPAVPPFVYPSPPPGP